MYCEGYWGDGACTADMKFSSDPTAQGDDIAKYVRRWYESNRETWRDRFWKRWRYCADEFMLGLINEVGRVQDKAEHQESEEHQRRENDMIVRGTKIDPEEIVAGIIAAKQVAANITYLGISVGARISEDEYRQIVTAIVSAVENYRSGTRI